MQSASSHFVFLCNETYNKRMRLVTKIVKLLIITIGLTSMAYFTHTIHRTESSNYSPELQQTRSTVPISQQCYESCTTTSQFSELPSIATVALLDSSSGEQPPARLIALSTALIVFVSIVSVFLFSASHTRVSYAELGIRRQ
jgi:uncharacterized membrane protein